MVVLALLTALAGVPTEPPPPVELTAEEQAEIDKGDIVVRVTATDTGGMVTGIADVSSTPEKLWETIFDFQARVDEIGALKAVSNYVETDTEIRTRWELKIVMTSIVFHTIYPLPQDGSWWCRYALDPEKEHDIVSAEGAYQLYEVGDNTRFVYRTQTDSGRRVPQWIKNWLAIDSTTDQMDGIRKRAESGT